ncbi:MAG: restriction endonuclease subunit S [Cyanobacteria bacterium J06621_3]
MDLKTFFENFDTLAEAPGGIARLRELILDMAVRGKLVPQDPKDPTAKETHKLLLAEQAQLRKEKKIRVGKKLSSVESHEVFVDIPHNWHWIRLNDVGDWGAGTTPLRSNDNYYGGSHPWFKSGELPDGLLEGPSKEMITDLALDECSLRRNQIGDVLIAMYGATIGKLAILNVPATTNQAVCACTCFSNLYNRYLFVFLLAWRKNFETMGAGAAQPNISRTKIINTPFPLPPLAEQKRIVAKVDELMKQCDRAEAAQQTRNTLRQNLRTSALDALMNTTSDTELETAWNFVRDQWSDLSSHPEDIKELRSVAQQVALRGLLTQRERNSEPIKSVLLKILAEQNESIASGKHKKAKGCVAIDKTRLSELPDGWTYCQLKDLTVFGPRNGYSPKAVEYPTKVRSITLTATTSGKFDGQYFKYLDKDIESDSHLWLQPGDLLVQRSNTLAYVGSAAIYDLEPNKYVYPDLIMRMRVVSAVNPDYIHLVLNSRDSKKYFQENASGTSGTMPKINQKIVNSLVVPLPPTKEQEEIVTKVDELMKQCDRLETTLRKKQQIAEALVASATSHLIA